MIVIGIDPHKSTHTATALDPATNTDLGSVRIEASLAEYLRLIGWAKAWPERTWAIENADGLGHHLALWLLARGELVLDIPTTATARVRELSRGGRRKNDHRCRGGQCRRLTGRCPSGPSGDHHRLPGTVRRASSQSVPQQNRIINQLHALLRELMAGGAPTSLTPAKATAALRGFRPRTGPDRVRVELAKDLFNDVRRFDDQLAPNARR
jgi:transposase